MDDWRIVAAATITMMRTIIVTGSAGLIGSETVRRFARDGAHVLGIDNDMRAKFFGAEASTKKTRDDLIANFRDYEHQRHGYSRRGRGHGFIQAASRHN